MVRLVALSVHPQVVVLEKAEGQLQLELSLLAGHTFAGSYVSVVSFMQQAQLSTFPF